MSPATRVAVDFDNTIVDYQLAFDGAAIEQGLLAAGAPRAKREVRDELRRRGDEAAWTELQGHVYGPGMATAVPYPGVLDFFRRCRDAGVTVAIISHRTAIPFLGPAHDLHAAARSWLARHGFFEPPIALDDVFFELTVEDKVRRIDDWGATHAIDDLPELLGHPDWPAHVRPILFDPHRSHIDEQRFARVASWAELSACFLHG